jgi:thiamine kinase-like enzyme
MRSRSNQYLGNVQQLLATDRANIRKYTAENKPTHASWHFSEVLGKKVPESNTWRLEAEVSSHQNRIYQYVDSIEITKINPYQYFMLYGIV